MSIVSELFIGDEQQAERHVASLDDDGEGVLGADERLPLDGVSDLNLEALLEIVVEELGEDDLDYELEVVEFEAGSVLAVPVDAVTLLAELTEQPDLLADVASAWSDSEETLLDPEDAETLVRSIAALAARADANDADLFLWTSL